jgi:hypothetical protein
MHIYVGATMKKAEECRYSLEKEVGVGELMVAPDCASAAHATVVKRKNRALMNSRCAARPKKRKIR